MTFAFLLLLLACVPHPVHSLEELDGDWAGSYQLDGAGDSSWGEGDLGLFVSADAGTASVQWEESDGYQADTGGAGTSDYEANYACSIEIARPGFVRLYDCLLNVNGAGDSTATAELDFLDAYLDRDRLYLDAYILDKLSAEDAAMDDQQML